MDTITLKKYLPQYVEMITEKSKGNNMYICPFCHSGTGKNKTGAFSLTEDQTHWNCFKCGKQGDIFSLVADFENIPSFTEQQERVQNLFEGVPLPYHKNTEKTKTDVQDYTQFFNEAHKNIAKTNYPTISWVK